MGERKNVYLIEIITLLRLKTGTIFQYGRYSKSSYGKN